MSINFLVDTIQCTESVFGYFFANKKRKRNTHPQKQDTFEKLKQFSITALIAPTAQIVRFLFSNVACRPRPRK